MARACTERALKRGTEKAVTVLKALRDVEQSSIAVGMVVCWHDPQSKGHGLRFGSMDGDLLPPELTKPPQLPLRRDPTLVASGSSGLIRIY